MRLDKLLADNGLGTRKEVTRLIRAGQVTLADRVLSRPGEHVAPDEAAALCVNGRPLHPRRYLHYLVHKPRGMLTATFDRHVPVAAELLPEAVATRGLVPVGRLDKDSEGLLLFTNDGQLNHVITSPKSRIPKGYKVTVVPHCEADGRPVRGPLNAEDRALFAHNDWIMDDRPLLPAELEILGPYDAHVTLYEGRNRQIRRMFEHLSLTVETLKRLTLGSLALGNLPPGAARPLRDEEAAALYDAVGMKDPDAMWRT